MAQPYTTRLEHSELTRDERLQVVNYYDVLSPEDDPTARYKNSPPRVYGPETGLTKEGHGKGIRVLVHQDITVVECERLLRELLRSVETAASIEIEDDVPWGAA
ncbi:hypothetical protein Q6D67_18615 [Haliea sp. E1-2-M8]|uniref:hypothetical protein n=1 Tax=Haliea sp. E1-2-M8 TaxID=3064706 RepID=UPI0027237FCD|nr:hypothetical protein [Haliea sp. E1-2-M8]MDO8863709.1 hypothetical protein [Haliea sp. E1-2-M8]